MLAMMTNLENGMVRLVCLPTDLNSSSARTASLPLTGHVTDHVISSLVQRGVALDFSRPIHPQYSMALRS